MRLILILLVGFGCSEPSIHTSEQSEPATTELDAAVVVRAETEIKALSTGSADKNWPIIERRIKTLQQMRDGRPAKWEDSNSTRDDCIDLARQLEALAIGRGWVSDSDLLNSRMLRLRNLLKQAGYEFDDVGYETPQPGVEPLLGS